MGKEKRTTTLNLESSLVDQAKKLNLNISQITNETLRFIIHTGEYQPAAVELFLIEMQIDRLDAYAEQVEGIYMETLDKVEELKKKKAELEEIIAQSKIETKIAELYRELALIVSEAKYDPEVAYRMSASVRERLSALGVDYGEYEEFKMYVERLMY